jgi:predicted dehydrogenase
MLSDPLIDAVYISSPNSSHAAYVAYALSMGKHVLCEKPLAYSINDMEKIKLASDGVTLLSTGFMYRLHPQYEVIRLCLRDANLISLDAHFNYSLDPQFKNIRLSKNSGGGCLLDVGCYLLDLVQYLYPLGEFNYSIGATMNDQLGIDSQIEIVGFLEGASDKAMLKLSASQNSERSQGLLINTDRLTIKTDSPFLVPRNKKVSLDIKYQNGREIRHKIPAFNQHTAQINLFSESIIRGELLGPLSTGIKNAVILSSLWSDINNMSKIDSRP